MAAPPIDPETILRTERLVLRPFTLADAAIVKRLAGAWEIADTTLNVPHPYEDGMAEEWIKTHAGVFAEGSGLRLAIVLREGVDLCGSIGLGINRQHSRGELGYWVGMPYWGYGYCTEAARAVLAFGFEVLGLNRIHASHFHRNPASGRVMQKLGMTFEGSQRRHVRKWEGFEDLDLYGILSAEWRAAQK